MIEAGSKLGKDLLLSGVVSFLLIDYNTLVLKALGLWNIDYGKVPNYVAAEAKTLAFKAYPLVGVAYRAIENPTKTGVKAAVNYVAKNTPLVTEKVTEYTTVAAAATTRFLTRLYKN